jgi:hypothetical protein
MSLKNLTTDEINVIGECIHAAIKGPFFEGESLHTLTGLERAELEDIARAWPNVNEDEENVPLAINNVLNNLLGYPHDCWDVWFEYVSVTPEQLRKIYANWLDQADLDGLRRAFFDRLR